MDVWPLLQGFGLGLSLAAPPGPVNAPIAREAARGGTWAGMRAGLPAPIVDTAYLALTVFGLSRLVDLQAHLPLLAGVGAVVLAFLAWSIVRVRAGPARDLTGPWAVWAVTLTNPFQYAWWASAGAAFTTTQGAWGVAGFLAAIFGWVAAWSLLVARAARLEWVLPFLEVAMADLLLAYALRLALLAAIGL
jgi:threonine/homoserine/homoserine lactone efflux protein